MENKDKAVLIQKDFNGELTGISASGRIYSFYADSEQEHGWYVEEYGIRLDELIRLKRDVPDYRTIESAWDILGDGRMYCYENVRIEDYLSSHQFKNFNTILEAPSGTVFFGNGRSAAGESCIFQSGAVFGPEIRKFVNMAIRQDEVELRNEEISQSERSLEFEDYGNMLDFVSALDGRSGELKVSG